MTHTLHTLKQPARPWLASLKLAALLIAIAVCLAANPLAADDEAEEMAEEAAEEAAEESAEEAAEEAAEESAEEAAEESAEEAAEEAAEESAEEAAEESAEEVAESELEEGEEDGDFEQEREEDRDEFVKESGTSGGEANSRTAFFEEFGERDLVVRQELLVMADTGQIDTLIGRAELSLVSRISLKRLSGELARFRVAQSYSPQQLSQRLKQQLPDASIDLNHGYQIAGSADQDPENPRLAGGVYQVPKEARSKSIRIGMIDTNVDTEHAAFSSSRITERDFLSGSQQRDLKHGTGVASLLVGRTETFQGIAPGNQLLVASVFADYSDQGLVATSHDLIAAMDWLVDQQANPINISLSGPFNQVVSAAVESLAKEGILLVAAVGNQGPFAKPRYPAAYANVIGVTAVDRNGRLYSQAGRGDQVDYSGPGVGMQVARAGSGTEFDSVSGTSYATPLITGLMLAYQQQYDVTSEEGEALQALIRKDMVDLGQPGRDQLFGHGLPGRTWIDKTLGLSE
ncbi:S8 family serine peptidase [Marinobacter halotolerans]|uniref:S8 family serine peptidase n=1 Tax=Marinobacter halotolerans TaxID=1569211 RepID=UPI001781C804|nr:S8 family serine peptidase [Marinobacter halotolerans]